MNSLIRNNELEINGEKIKLPLPIPICVEIAYRTMRGELIGAYDIACNYKLSEAQAIAVITNPAFCAMVHNLAVANARHSFDSVAFTQLLNIARFSADEKNKISAIKTLADIVGTNESKKKISNTNINISIDALVRQNDNSPFKGF